MAQNRGLLFYAPLEWLGDEQGANSPRTDELIPLLVLEKKH